MDSSLSEYLPAPQSEQNKAPVELNFPFRHNMHSAAASALYFPPRQTWQDTPSEEKDPAWHLKQVKSPMLLSYPEGHSTHSLWSAEATFPAGHLEQLVLLYAALNSPGSQAAQNEAPPWEYVPGRQLWQRLSVADAYFPPSQNSHLVRPLAGATSPTVQIRQSFSFWYLETGHSCDKAKK